MQAMCQLILLIKINCLKNIIGEYTAKIAVLKMMQCEIPAKNVCFKWGNCFLIAMLLIILIINTYAKYM